ncbi:unnamed protein product [Protopolystoma xenopodis]|uniref:Uncharacterized protein n=1 Tax=Protopolystoma xenopodis TaxID=117903 RepID=A0A448X1Q7_9PLAT|nr:unnamed protein product [Protopolystoma xenopodis]
MKTASDAASCPCEEDTLSNELGTLWQEGNCKLESRLPSRWQHLVDCITQDNLHQGHFEGFEPTRLGLQIVSSEVWLTTNREDLDYRKAAILTLSRTDSAHIRHSLAGTCDSNLAVSVLPQSNKVHQPSWAPASLLKESADMSVWTIPNLSPATESRACLGLVTCGAFYRRTITAFCCLNDRGTEASGQLEGSLGGPSAGATGLPAPAPDWRRAEMAERLLPSGLSATKEVWLAWLVTVLMTLLAVSVVKAAVFGLTEGDLASLAGAGMSVLVGSGLVTYQVYSARLEGPE